MDLLHIDFQSVIPDVVDTLSYVYGEKYRDSIQEKINKTIIFYFFDFYTLNSYIDDFETFQARKSAFQFLERNGINKDKSSEAFSSLISSPNYFVNGLSPILAFGNNYTGNDFSRLLAKKQVINFFLGPSNKIDDESLNDFIRTDKYTEIETIAKEFNENYEAVLTNYLNTCEEMQHVKDFLKDEEVREEAVRNTFSKKFCTDIMYLLPPKTQEVLSNVDEDELVKIFLPPKEREGRAGDLEDISCFEAFSKENRDKLANRGYAFSLLGRATIAKQRGLLDYLKKLGISDEDLDFYLPSEKQIEQIARSRVLVERAAKDYYLITRKDFVDFQESFGQITTDDPLFAILKKAIHDHQARDYDASVNFRMYDDEDMNLHSIMLYSIRKMGELFYTFLHECTHVCEQKDSHEIGFDIDFRRNKYNEKYRQYERFNETLSDYFTRKGLKFLHSKSKFLIEPEELTNMDYSSNNTPAENALLLEPLLFNPKYREAIIEVKNGGDPVLFFQLIGKNNFDRLIEVLNHVDFLASMSNFKTNEQLQREYELACMEATSIYQDIDNYVKTRQAMI